MPRPDWYTYFDHHAQVAAERATCPRAQCGAVIVDWTSKVMLATGYNGAPRGMAHCEDAGCQLEALEGGGSHCVRVVHAEMNALLNAARTGAKLDGAVLFLNSSDGRPPCQRCEVAMRQAGVTRWYTNAGGDA